MFAGLIIVKRARHLKVIRKLEVKMQIGGIAYINCLRGEKKNSSGVDWLHHLATTLSKILW